MDDVSKREEYWYNVSPQDSLPIAGSNEALELEALNILLDELAQSPLEIRREIIRNALIKEPSLFNKFRLFIGISNKRAYLDLSYIFRNSPHPDGKHSLCGCSKNDLYAHELSFFLNMLKKNKNSKEVIACSSEIVTKYLEDKGLNKIISVFAKLSTQERKEIIERVILPHELQQSEAKRRGHGAEAIFASLVESLGCKLLPQGKAINPMGCKDIRLDKNTFEIKSENSESTRSYDMVVSDKNDSIRIAVIALIHSSDPGEYGVAKAARTIEHKREIERYNKDKPKNKHIYLCALIDGTGFAENKKDTLNIILKEIDWFIQINTLYKIGFLLHDLGMCNLKAFSLDDSFYSLEEKRRILNYVPQGVKIISKESDVNPNWKRIRAGKGMLFL